MTHSVKNKENVINSINYMRDNLRKKSMLKEFGPEDLKVKEVVALKSSLCEYASDKWREPDIFCIRIDADEF